jgi:hypothetical protein
MCKRPTLTVEFGSRPLSVLCFGETLGSSECTGAPLSALQDKTPPRKKGVSTSGTTNTSSVGVRARSPPLSLGVSDSLIDFERGPLEMDGTNDRDISASALPG